MHYIRVPFDIVLRGYVLVDKCSAYQHHGNMELYDGGYVRFMDNNAADPVLAVIGEDGEGGYL